VIAKPPANTSKRKSKTAPILGDFFWMRDDAESYILEIMEKKELTERYMFSFMNLELWDTYLELIWTIAYLSIFSFLFKWSEVNIWVGPAILLSGAIVASSTLIFSMYRNGKMQSLSKKNKDYSRRLLDANICGFIWLFWCVYSTVMKQFPETARLPELWSYPAGICAFVVVLFTYKNVLLQGSWKNVSGALLLIFLLLLPPHFNSINFELEGIVYFFKIVGFFVIYLATEIELQLADLIENGIQSITNNVFNNDDKNDDPTYTNRYLFRLKRTELIIIRSSWILFCPNYLLFLCFVQIYPVTRQLSFSYRIYKMVRQNIRKKDPTLSLAFENDDDDEFRRDTKTKRDRTKEELAPKKTSSTSKAKHIKSVGSKKEVPVKKKKKTHIINEYVSSSSSYSSSLSSSDEEAIPEKKSIGLSSKSIKKSKQNDERKEPTKMVASIKKHSNESSVSGFFDKTKVLSMFNKERSHADLQNKTKNSNVHSQKIEERHRVIQKDKPSDERKPDETIANMHPKIVDKITSDESFPPKQESSDDDKDNDYNKLLFEMEPSEKPQQKDHTEYKKKHN
jgi:hypothetical protein